MAVAELPSQAVALPRRAGRSSSRTDAAEYAAWVPLVGILMGIASLFYLAQTSEVAATGYSIQQLQAEEDNWKLRNEQLSLELARAKSLSTIEQQATKRLGMVPALDIVYLKGPAPISGRSEPSARGESRAVPALEKSVPANSDPLDPVRASLSSLLAPRQQPPQR